MTNTSAVTDDLITQLKRANPSVELNHLSMDVGGELFEMIAKTPGGEYDRWNEQRQSEDPQIKAGRNKVLLASCRVWPEPGEYLEMIARKPGLADSWAGELLEAAGMGRSAKRKKL